jgi:hypothetical protein
MKIDWLVFYALTIFLVSIVLNIWFNIDKDVVKEVSIVVSNLISGYLGYLVRQMEK